MKKVVYTMVRDESVFLPIWLKYYSRFFNPQNIFVFNHNSSDGSIETAEKHFQFNRIDVDHPTFNDFEWYTSFIQQRQHEFLNDYDVVLFSEADEIVWHEKGLAQYIQELEKEVVRTNGLMVWHNKEQEDSIDLTRPLMEQRRYCSEDKWSCKPLISKVPLEYSYGFHSSKPEGEIDPNLYLFHLHCFDFELAHEKHKRTRAYKDYSKKSIERKDGFQGRLIGEDFESWFQEKIEPKGPQEIPQIAKQICNF